MLTDKDTNNISLIDVLERVTVHDPAAPAGEVGMLVIRAELISMWARENFDVPETGLARVRLLGPDNQLLLETKPFNIDLSTHPRARTGLKLTGIPSLTAGIHTFFVDYESEDSWTTLAKIPLEIRFEPESPQETA
jgi:hypothetical protein